MRPLWRVDLTMKMGGVPPFFVMAASAEEVPFIVNTILGLRANDVFSSTIEGPVYPEVKM